MLVRWHVDGPQSPAFQKHVSRIPDYLWSVIYVKKYFMNFLVCDPHLLNFSPNFTGWVWMDWKCRWVVFLMPEWTGWITFMLNIIFPPSGNKWLTAMGHSLCGTGISGGAQDIFHFSTSIIFTPKQNIVVNNYFGWIVHFSLNRQVPKTILALQSVSDKPIISLIWHRYFLRASLWIFSWLWVAMLNMLMSEPWPVKIKRKTIKIYFASWQFTLLT